MDARRREPARRPALRFGPFRLDGPDGLLWRQDRVVPLPPKPTAVLWSLASRAGQLVTKGALLDAAWPDTAVTETVLTGSIRTLREALGDEPTRPRYIETVHRRGYRFVGPVHAEADPSPSVPSLHPEPPPEPAEPAPFSAAASICVGRQAELALLVRSYDETLQGRRQTVFVTGEPGIGKTTLVDAFVSELGQREAVWMGRGQCVEQYGAGEPYLPLLDVLGELCAGRGAAECITQLRRHAPSWLGQLPALLGEVERDGLQREARGATRARMLRELADFVDALATTHPLVWVLEDLHWSDPSTVEVLALIARRRAHARCLVIGTYRPVELILRQHPLKAAKEELRSHGQCVEIVLGHLSDAAVADYLARRAPGAAAPSDVTAFVQRRTQGHPLFMATLADYLVAEDRKSVV